MKPLLRNWLIIAGILAATLTLGLAVARRYQVTRFSRAPSSFNASPFGLKAAYVTLDRLHDPVARWQHPWTKLARQSGLLIYADLDPDEHFTSQKAAPPTEEEARALARWVARGNTLLLLANPRSPMRHSVATLLAELDLTFEPWTSRAAAEETDRESPTLAGPARRESTTLRSVMPASFTWGVNQVSVAEHAGLRPDGGAFIPVAAGANDTVDVLWLTHGRGQVVLFSSAAFFDNEFLGRADNLTLFLNLLRRFAAGQSILFDEYHHGYSQEFAMHDFLALPMVKFAAAQLALVIGLLIWSQWRRFGEPVPLGRETRRSVMEYAVSLGDLYARAETQTEALDYLYRHSRRELTERHGLRPDATPAEIAARLGGHREAWEQLAQECEQHLATRKLTRQQFAHLARRIQQFWRQLQ